MPSRIPVTIVGGYLGAGKTTLLNALLHGRHGIRLAVIVNDFGSVNIDAALIANRSGETISLTNGCVCCGIGGDLAMALHRLAEPENGYDHIVIEASGVADLGRLANLCVSESRVALDCIVAVADAEATRILADDRYVGEVVRHQLQAADIIVLSKTDLIGAEDQRQVRTWLADAAPQARTFDGAKAGLFEALILAGGTRHLPECQGHDADHARQFATWTFVHAGPLDGERLRAVLDDMPAAVLRAKGLVMLADSPGTQFVLQLVGPRWSLEPAPQVAWCGHSVIVCIGPAPGFEAHGLAALFAECSR